MATCANGHESDWDDYCSVCGDAIGGATSGGDSDAASTSDPAGDADPTSSATATPPAPAAPSGPTCANCADPHDPDDTFCETCGYDFATGSLPDALPATPSTASAPAGQNGEPLPAVVAIVSADAIYFATAVEGDGADDLDFPDPVPPETRVPLTGAKVLIGRHSQSRGIYPEIDLASITEDPAVSGRHAMLHRADDGSWTISDLGSTNGTTVSGQPIDPGVDIDLPLGTPILLGAWSRIVLE